MAFLYAPEREDSMKAFFKKVAVVGMSLALALGSCVISVDKPAEAASGPTMAKSVEIIIGHKRNLKIDTHNYMMMSVIPKSSRPWVATCYNKNNRIHIRALTVGKTTITTKIRATKNKKTKIYKLKTKVTILPKNYDDVKVLSFSDLDKNLAEAQKNGGGTVTLNTSESKNYTVKDDYSKVNLVVYAPNATIENSHKFKSITINSLKEDGWSEHASGNKFTLASTVPTKLYIDMGSTVESVTCEGTVGNALQTVRVQGTLNKATVTGNAPVRFEGPSDPSRISLIVVNRLGANVEIDTNIGATLSKVEVKKACDVELTGNSTAVIRIDKVKEANVKIAEALTGAVVNVTN